MPKKQTALRSVITSTATYAWLAAAMVVMLGALFIYHQRHSSAVQNATTRRPESFTELYFSNPNNLPVKISHGHALPVSFVVHNMENRAITYTYTVSFLTATGRTSTLAHHSLTLAAGAKQTVIARTPHLPVGYTGRGEVNVTLRNHPETIHYWVEVV